MKIAFWTVTRSAGNLAVKYREIINRKQKGFEIEVFTLEKYEVENTNQMNDFTETLEEKFNSFDGHVFIMAAGIVVRKISKVIRSKDSDPAVLIADEGENFVISLLSGHLGGANELTYKLSDILNLVPIITTSSDVTGKIAVDTLSQKLNCEMENLDKAKTLTSLIVDGKKVNLLLPENISLGENGNPEGIIIISNRENIPEIRVYPRNLIIGIGCRRGTAKEVILHGVEMVMKKNNLSYKSIKKIATVDVKKDETGLIEAAQYLGKSLEIVTRDEISKVEDKFTGSDFVKKTIGVSCVSEPCSYIVSNRDGKFLERKYIYKGVTISIYEEKFGNE